MPLFNDFQNITDLFIKGNQVLNIREAKKRYKIVNIFVILFICLYSVYRYYEIVCAGNISFIDMNQDILALVLFGAGSVLLIAITQDFRLFAEYQPFIVSMILVTGMTAGSMMTDEFGLYFNMLNVVSIIMAFYLSPKNYVCYFIVISIIVLSLYFSGIYHLTVNDGITLKTSKLLALIFFELETLGICLLLFYIERLIKRVEQRDKTSLFLLATAAELRDDDTGNHLLRTTYYAGIIIMDLIRNPKQRYPITEKEGSYILSTIKLHDVGKIGTPDNILNKPGKLTIEEFETMKNHTKYGAKLFEKAMAMENEKSDLLPTAYNIACYHHEKWDGSGYPNGLCGFAIPLSARITAIADVFDALTTKRPYKEAFSPRKSFDIMYEESGHHFDPYLIEIVKRHEKDFVETLEKFK